LLFYYFAFAIAFQYCHLAIAMNRHSSLFINSVLRIIVIL
jgi:hypothetical protein